MNNNYKKERIKPTILYTVILNFIITIFSFIVLQTQNQQFTRFERLTAPNRPLGGIRIKPSDDEINRINKIIDEIKAENFRNILFVDFIILIPAVILSYYLFGKTLEPIVDSLNRQKRFVSDASHELKTPLTNIKTEADVLKRSKQSTLEEYKEFTANVIEDVNRLDDLVITLLDSARSEYDQTPIHKTELNINNLLRNLSERFDERSKKKI